MSHGVVFIAHGEHRRAVIQAARIAGRYAAVCLEDRLQLAERFNARIPANALIPRYFYEPLTRRYRDSNDLRVERSAILRRGRSLMAL